MAASDATPFPIKNQAYRVTFPILDNDGDLVTDAAGLDSEISKDGGTFADCTNEATQIAESSGMYYLDLTATEMNADTVAIIIKTTTTNAKTTPIVLYPAEPTDIPVNVKAISDDTGAADNLEADYDGTGYAKANSTVGTCTANSDMRGTNSAATAAALGTHDGKLDTVDTVADAIKTKTDNLPADPASETNVSTRSSHTAAAAGTDAAAKVLATPAQKLATDATGKVTVENVNACKADVTNLDAAVSSRSSHTAADVWSAATRTLTSFGTLAQDIWNKLTSALTTAGSVGKLIVDNLNATISSRSPEAGGNVAAIKAKTDLLPADPASETNVDANETKIDTLDQVADAVKVVTDKLADTLEDDAGTPRFTENALEQAPSGSGGDATEAKQDTIITGLTDVKGTGFVKDTNSLVNVTGASPVNIDHDSTSIVNE